MLHTGIYPEQLKISKVFPMHGVNDKMRLTNYRPIALLPSSSKIFECVLLEQLIIILPILIYCLHSSTGFAVLDLVDHLTYKLDTGKIPTIYNYIDLSKAFNTLIHDILLDK